MTGFFPRTFCLAVLLLLVSGTSRAQDTPETEPADSEAELIKKEAIEASSDLRDAVNENLGTIREDAQTADELQQFQKEQQELREQTELTPATKPLQAEPITAEGDSVSTDPSLVSPESGATESPVAKKTFTERMRSVPIFLQSVPDRVPFLRKRGMIFFGRAELDYAHYSSGSAKSDSGFRLRSLRAGLARAYKYNISAKAEVDFTDGDSSFADLYVRYNNKKYGLFTIGNQRVAQTLVNQTSRISRTFMEEPLPAEAFGLGRRLAVGWDLHKKKGGIHVTVFGSDLNGSIGDSGYAGRFYLNPKRSRLTLFHIGASYVSENMSRKTRFYSHPESRVTDERFVDTGIYDQVNHQNISALEIAGARGPFMFRSEMFQARWNLNFVEDAFFRGIYAQASWVLTGEHFKYTQGKFIRIRPQNPHGAWEAAVRFSSVDLNDRNIKGGEERNLSVALNWYAPGNQFRVMCNLIRVRTDENAGDESPLIFQLRGQFHW